MSTSPSKRRRAPRKRAPSQVTQTGATIESLRRKGFRITKGREALVEILCKRPRPLSALEVQRELTRRGLTINKTTVYRELDFLVTQGFATRIDLLDGQKRYEQAQPGHHHHLVCTGCRSITCIDMCSGLGALERQIQSSHKFVVRDHVLEFFGICVNCR